MGRIFLSKKICSQGLKDKSGFRTWFSQVDDSRVGELVAVNAPLIDRSTRHFLKDVLGINVRATTQSFVKRK